jgi:hypothetical protein
MFLKRDAFQKMCAAILKSYSSSGRECQGIVLLFIVNAFAFGFYPIPKIKQISRLNTGDRWRIREKSWVSVRETNGMFEECCMLKFPLHWRVTDQR